MKVNELKAQMTKYPEAVVRVVLPNGDTVPAHAHVTEVGRVDKRFIDCGGTLRNESVCRLQTWFANDVEHRLTAGKLAKILDKAAPVLMTDDLDVDVEHEVGYVSQFPLQAVEVSANAVTFQLAERHTDCLAKDKCGVPPSVSEFNPMKFNFRGEQPSVGCCR
jgi:hypothetical protein